MAVTRSLRTVAPLALAVLLGVQPSGNFTSTVERLKAFNTTDVNSIRQALALVRAGIGGWFPAERDSAFFAFSALYYATIGGFNDRGSWGEPALMRQLNSARPDSEPAVRAFKKELADNGLGLYMTEGNYYVDALPGYLYDNFSKQVSPSVQEFLRLRKDELAAGFSEDAGLLISFEDLGRRVIAWERYLDSFPDSPLRRTARAYWELYLSTLLTGLDNSRIFEFDSDRLRPEVKAVYLDYINTYPATKSGMLVGAFYRLLEGRNFEYSEAVDRFYRENNISSMLGVQPPTR